MSGESNIDILMGNLNPQLHESCFVFTHLSKKESVDWSVMMPLGMFQEQEGTTLILTKHAADTYDLPYENIFSCITLQVHSSLHAVGLTATVSQALAKENIPANMVAAYHHDHVFVPQERASDALNILKNLSKRS